MDVRSSSSADGCRAQLRYDRRSVSLRTRNGRDCSVDFPELEAIPGVLAKPRVTRRRTGLLRDDGRPDFALLRRRLSNRPKQTRLPAAVSSGRL